MSRPNDSKPSSGSGDLTRLFAPRAIAVLGATESAGKIGRIVFAQLVGGDRPVYPVHPDAERVLDHRAYHSVAELPEPVDLAVLAMGAAPTVAACAECAARGIPFVIAFAGGFGEVGGDGVARERALYAAIAATPTRLLGPNTLGVMVPENGLDTIFVDHDPEALGSGGIAFVTQSGSVGTEALAVAAGGGFGLRAFVGLGNRLDLGEAELLDHFGADPATRCAALYLETLGDGRDLLERARAVARRKPVVALKAGRTPGGAAAAGSHTGRLAGSDQVVSGAFRQHGVQRAADEVDLTDAARVLGRAPLPAGRRVAVVSPGGGYGVMATDLIEATSGPMRLEMATLSPATEARLRQLAPPWASVRNPVDLSASATDDMTVAAVAALADDPGVDLVLHIALFAPPAITDGSIDRILAVQATATKPIVVLVQHGAETESVLRRFYAGGVVGFPGVARAVRGLSRLVERADLVEQLAESDPEVRPRTSPGVAIADWLAGLAVPGRPDEAEVKQLLAGYGVTTPPGRRLAPGAPIDPGDLRFPLAVKVCSPEVQHKSDHGGVILGVGPAELEREVTAIRARFPGAAVLIEEQVAYPEPELIVGALHDRELGPAVMVGAGGLLAELHGDVGFRLAPCSPAEAGRLVDELTVAPVLSGYRGHPADRAALTALVSRIADLAVDLGPHLGQLDINPLVWGERGWTALDALLLLS